MGEFVLDFKATGTEEFAKAAKDTTQALDRQEANARKMSKWRNELAQLARSERDAAEKRLPIEKQMETLLQRRVQLEERIARAGNNQMRRTALLLQQRRNDARIGTLQNHGKEDSAGPLGLLGGLGSRLLGLFSVGVVARWAVGVVKGAEAVQDLADALRTTRKEASAFVYAAHATNTEVGQITSVFQGLAEVQGAVQAGLGRTGDKVKSMEKLFGQTIDQLNRKSPSDLFVDLSEKIKDMGLTDEENAAGIRLFGPAFSAFVSAANDDLAKFVKDYKKNFGQLKDENASLLDSMKTQWNGFWAGVGERGKDVLAVLIKWVSKVGGSSAAFGDPIAMLGVLAKNAIADNQKKITEEGPKQTAENRRNEEAKSTSRQNIKSMNALAKDRLGEDADQAISDWDRLGLTADGRADDLRQRERQMSKQGGTGNRGGGGGLPSSDALQRIGLFVGDPTGVRKEIQTQTRMLADIKRAIERMDNNLQKE